MGLRSLVGGILSGVLEALPWERRIGEAGGRSGCYVDNEHIAGARIAGGVEFSCCKAGLTSQDWGKRVRMQDRFSEGERVVG